MEKLESHKTHKSYLPPIFLFLLLSLGLTSSDYTLPDKYFINCGSDTNVNKATRMFTGDLNSDSIFFSKQSNPITADRGSSQDLYHTARIFRQENSFYEFEISSYATHLVRLHFFSFPSPINLSMATFNVSTSDFVLLHDFTVQSGSQSPMVKDFLISLSVGKFRIYFIPQASSLAFVNAIEVFPVDPPSQSYIPNNASHISFTGNKTNFQGIHSKALKTIYRINVGGSLVTQDNDTLLRTWVPDDSYLYNPDDAKNISSSGNLNYQGVVSKFTAPESVYQTAKQMNLINSSNNVNLTWSFNVSKNVRHFIRVHFCDIISISENVITFNLYIGGNYRQEINPANNYELYLMTPFYIDFVVDSDDHGIMNISVGPNQVTLTNNSFLNGLEIMELMEKSNSVIRGTNGHKNKDVLLVVGSVLGGSALICLLAVVLVFGLKYGKKKPAELPRDWSPLPIYGGGSAYNRMTEGTPNGTPIHNLNLGLKIPLVEILVATNNFDSKVVIGKGGFGPVYTGILRNGMKVAVKRGEPGSGQGLPEFQTEIMVLSKIRHRHLVSLIGYCDERMEMILVYEFMEKGTLRDHLYQSKFPCLSWKQRLEICIGGAAGLHYLHKGAAGGIIHRDVKSSNILLDKNLVAKVADFGLSRLGPPDETHVTTGVKGTFGYFDPEYFRSHQLTEKSDVYSFGVVLLEVLCARPAISPSLPREQVNLAEWGVLCKNKGLLEEIVDPLIKDQIAPYSLRKFAETAEKCLQEYGADRPTMSDVLWDLEYALRLQQTAAKREPHEDSTDDPSSALPWPNFRSFPSLSMSMDKEEMPILSDHGSVISSASKVFSELGTEDAR